MARSGLSRGDAEDGVSLNVGAASGATGASRSFLAIVSRPVVTRAATCDVGMVGMGALTAAGGNMGGNTTSSRVGVTTATVAGG